MPAPNQNLFAEFPPITKAEWMAKIEKDLKGRPLSDLDWQGIPPLSISPFLHADDFTEHPEPILNNHPSNTWAIGEDIEVTDFVAANNKPLPLCWQESMPRASFSTNIQQKISWLSC